MARVSKPRKPHLVVLWERIDGGPPPLSRREEFIRLARVTPGVDANKWEPRK